MSGLDARQQATGSASVNATKAPDGWFYRVPVTIGGQNFLLQPDSGSTKSWVYNTLLPASDTTGHDVFDPSKSPSFSQTGVVATSNYSSGGSYTGDEALVPVQVGDVTMPTAEVDLPTQMVGLESTAGMDGTFGLSPASTLGQSLMPQLNQSLFTADLRRDGASLTGTLDFGLVDPTKFTGSLSSFDASQLNFTWRGTCSSFTVGRVPSNNAGSIACSFDTGSSDIGMSSDLFSFYAQMVPGVTSNSSGYVRPCNAAPPPDLSITIGNGVQAVVPGGMTVWPPDPDDGNCYGAMQDLGDTGPSEIIFGLPFFFAHFVVFGWGNKQVMIGQKAVASV
ncbi:MAG: hypothetical protein M1838_003509 [Thelocarpon superellum]|nr:MAG: hypothetical protein M1838_003509 [Thelocarpon superellum]